MRLGLERLVDIEGEAALSGATASVVETDVYVLFKLPSVANTIVGKQVLERFTIMEHIAHSHPHDNAVASPNVLTQL